MEYILGKKEPECIFCSYPKKTNDRDNLILYRSAHNFVMMNKYPYINGHLLISPLRHQPGQSTAQAKVRWRPISR